MKHKKLRFGEGFRVSLGNRRSQAAEMVIPPGDAEGDARNRHRGADQWLFVISGRGVATLNGKRVTLKAGSLLLIEHQMRVVMNLCHRVVVLDYGEKIAEGKPEEVRKNRAVIEAYLGETQTA